MKEQALYDYILQELNGHCLEEMPDGISVPEGVSTDDFIRVLENVERDIRDERLAE